MDSMLACVCVCVCEVLWDVYCSKLREEIREKERYLMSLEMDVREEAVRERGEVGRCNYDDDNG